MEGVIEYRQVSLFPPAIEHYSPKKSIFDQRIGVAEMVNELIDRLLVQ
jgi:hypothetical protein